MSMKEKLADLRAKYDDVTLRAGLAATAMVPGFVFAQATGISAEIDTAKTEILGYIATWGAAFIMVALAGVGWRVGAKLIKRMAGAA